MTRMNVEIQQADVERANALLSAAQGEAIGIDPPVLELGLRDSYHLSYATYPMSDSTPWTTRLTAPPSLPYGSAPAGVPALRIWQLPESLVNVPLQPTAALAEPPLPSFEPKVASVDESSGATQSSAVPYYGWATKIGVTVKKLSASASTPAATATYELIGANEYETVLLERILTAAGLSLPGFSIDRLTLLHSATSGPPCQTDDGDGVTTFIAQSNLSTVTQPPGLARTLSAPVPGGAQTPEDFVRLLWECSITRSGGFYLYYCSDPKGSTGLPDAIFNDKGEATLTLLLLYGAPSEPARWNRVASYMNALVTGGFIDASSAVYAQARPMPAYAEAGSSDGLKTLATTYRMTVPELAAANVEVALQAPLTVNGGSYVVAPSKPGQDPTAIAAWFGTTVAALASSNPGVDLGEELELWSTIALPNGLTVSPGTAERRTLGEVATFYAVTVEALAEENAEKAIFAGQTIETAQLTTPGAGETLSDLAASHYMDSVQLAEDNRDVQLASGAEIVVNGGVYEVPATAGTGTLDAIAARFGVASAEIERANPELSWPGPQPPWTLVLLPAPLTVTVGTSPNAVTFGQIASHYGARLAQLALDNDSKPGLFAVPLRTRGGPLARQAASLPGTVTYGMTRTAAPPATDTEPKSALERLYSLLSYRMPAGLKDFASTNPGPPLGPLTAPSTGGGDKMRPPQTDGVWRYQKAIPYAKLARASQSNGAGPDPAKSPYLGVGRLLQLDFAWNDLFGNRGLTPLSDPSLSPGAPLNRPPARAMYTDPIVGLSEWPSIGLDYEVVAGDADQATLEISIAFDGCEYLVHGEMGCPESPSSSKLDPVARAKRDMSVYERIWYQLAPEAGGGLAITVDTTILPGVPRAVEAEPLKAFAAAIYEWLSARASGTTIDPIPAMNPIAVPLDLAEVQPAQIFELDVTVAMSRPAARVDPDLRVEGKVATNASTIPPRHAREAEGGPYTLKAFAESFEAAMNVAGDWRMKLAVGVDRERAERSGAGAPLWAVRLGLAAQRPLPLAVRNPTAPTAYAPRPISNTPRTAKAEVKSYVTGSGLTAPTTPLSFAGIDLDRWMQQLLAAVDDLLSPACATAIGLVDSRLEKGRSPHLQALANAKEELAIALGKLVIPVLPGASGGDPAAARELFVQQLLVQLGSFYTTDAIVQLEVEVASQCDEPATSPRLFGNLKQPEGGEGREGSPVTLSSPKVPLAESASGAPPTLTFLLSTAAGYTDVAESEAQITLELTYDGTNIEHQIGTLPGIEGYRPSSWLSFVLPEPDGPLTVPLGAIDVPLVLRGFPTPPTVREQSGTQAVADKTPGLKLEQTLAWDYRLLYSLPIHYQQDTVQLTLEFNHVGNADPGRTDAPNDRLPDPFAPLAQFVTSYPQVQDDIETYVAGIEPGKVEPDSLKDGDVALTTFVEMVDAVTAALTEAPLSSDLLPGPLPTERYELAIAEETVSLESRKQSGQSIEALCLRVKDVPDALGAAVVVDVEGCSAQKLPTGDDGGDPKAHRTFAYAYVDSSTGDWLPATAAETIPARMVTVPGLNVLARQDAWASAWIGRNESAVEAFQYRTPTVYFASPQYPTNAYTEPAIEVAAIGSGSPQKRSPEQHLQALFGALFAHAPAGEQTVQLECRYQYLLSGEKLAPIDLPVYLLAPTAVDPKKDLVIPGGGCPTDPAQGPLVCRLGGAMRTWWEANLPSEEGGVFPLTVTVMSEITAQPLIVLANLRLGAEWIVWA